MSDEPLGGVYEPNAEAGQPSQEAPEQPKYVTADDLEVFADKLVKRFQSMTDQDITKRIKREVEKFNTELSRRVEAARNAGITVTEAQQQAARDQFTQQLLSTELVDEAPAQAVLQPAVDPATVKRVNLELAKLQAQYELIPDETEPEFRGMNWGDPDPDRFLSDYRRRFEKMARRVGKLPADQQPQEPPMPGVRVPVQGGSPAKQQALIEQYKNEVAKAGTVNERLNIRQKYRELGLEI